MLMDSRLHTEGGSHVLLTGAGGGILAIVAP
jgi:hypothetical protein